MSLAKRDSLRRKRVAGSTLRMEFMTGHADPDNLPAAILLA